MLLVDESNKTSSGKGCSLAQRRKTKLFLQTNNKINRSLPSDQKVCNGVTLPNDIRKLLEPGRLYIGAIDLTVTPSDLIAVKDLKKGRLTRLVNMRVKGSEHTLTVKQSRMISDSELMQMCDRDRDRIDRELSALRRKTCPNSLLTLYGFIFTREEFWICSEPISVSLDQFYVFVWFSLNKRLPEDFIAEVCDAVFSALSYLQQNTSTYHRDVKPVAVYLTATGDIKFANYGIMNFAQHSMRCTSSNVVGQRRPYVSPERLTSMSSAHCDTAEVWSAGLTLMELALGRFPYIGFSKMSVFEQLEKIVYGKPPQLSEECGYSDELRILINSCLIHDANARPSTSDINSSPYLSRYRHQPLKKDAVKAYTLEMLDRMQLAGADRRQFENLSDEDL